MNKVLVMCKETGQSKAFKKDAVAYKEKNNLPFEWVFANDTDFVNMLDGVDIVLISPEMILVQAKVKEELDKRGVKHIDIKPADFGLRRIDNILKLLK